MVLIVVFWLTWTFFLLTVDSSPETQHYTLLQEKQITYATAVSLLFFGVYILTWYVWGIGETSALALMVVGVLSSLYVLLRKAY